MEKRKHVRLEEAQGFLLLTLQEGPMTWAGLKKKAEAQGIGYGTLYAARLSLGFKEEKDEKTGLLTLSW